MELPVTIDQYRLVTRLGAGAMAEVYLAHWVDDPEVLVAVKSIHTHLMRSNPELVSGLVNEARICQRLTHSNIIRVYDFIEGSNVFYMVMEFVDGITLDELIAYRLRQGGRIELAAVLEAVIQALEGLDTAHGLKDDKGNILNLVHRDLKPSNVMVSRDGTVKVLDFGVAKARDNVGDATATGVAKGTPRYMSPEQITGDPLGPESDLFAVASLLYKAATAKNLFPGDGVAQVMSRVLRADTREASSALDGQLPGLGAVLSKATRLRPEKRYRNAAAFSSALKPLLAKACPDGSSRELLAHLVEQVYPYQRSALVRGLKVMQSEGNVGPNVSRPGTIETTEVPPMGPTESAMAAIPPTPSPPPPPAPARPPAPPAAAPPPRVPAPAPVPSFQSPPPSVAVASQSLVRPTPKSQSELNKPGLLLFLVLFGVMAGLLLREFVLKPSGPAPVAPIALQVVELPSVADETASEGSVLERGGLKLESDLELRVRIDEAPARIGEVIPLHVGIHFVSVESPTGTSLDFEPEVQANRVSVWTIRPLPEGESAVPAD